MIFNYNSLSSYIKYVDIVISYLDNFNLKKFIKTLYGLVTYVRLCKDKKALRGYKATKKLEPLWLEHVLEIFLRNIFL